MDQKFIRELRPPGHRRIRLIHRNLTQCFALGEGHLPGQNDIQLAFRRTDKSRWFFLGEGKIHENRRIVDFYFQLLCAHRVFERQRKIKREDLVRIVEPIIRRRIGEISLFSISGRKGEIVELLE